MKLIDARNYLKEHKKDIRNEYRPKFHASTPLGWANDPNGLSYFNNKFHMFYQHFPYKEEWGPMHWGHFTSSDLIKWENEEVALAPEEEYENTGGCFSGSAISYNDELVIFYTGVSEKYQEAVCKATSKDGINFIKDKNNPIIFKKDILEEGNIDNFRDPFITKKNDTYYLFIGGSIDRKGNIFMFKSDDLTTFEYVGKLFDSKNKNSKSYFDCDEACECPSFYFLDEKELIMLSPMGIKQQRNNYQNNNNCVFVIGNINLKTGSFNIDNILEIDHGSDFYAPLGTYFNSSLIMIGWKEMWKRNYPTSLYGYAGTFTLPREIKLKNNHVYCFPYKNIESYFKNEINVKNIDCNKIHKIEKVEGNSFHLYLNININNYFKMEFLKDDKYHLDLEIKDGVLSLDRTSSLLKINNNPDSNEKNASRRCVDLQNLNIVELDIYVDISSIEIFIDKGYDTLTMNVYNPLSAKEINIEGDSLIKELIFHNID